MHQLVLTLPGGTAGGIRGRGKEGTMTAPLQVIALSFSREGDAEDRILAEVDRLRGRGVLRLLDMLFVTKSQDGTIERLAVGNDEDFGSLLAAVVPVADGGPPGRHPVAPRQLLTRAMPRPWPGLSSRGPLWPSCSSSTTGPPRCSTPSPRPAAR